MKKRLFTIIVLSSALSFSVLGCTKKEADSATVPAETVTTTPEKHATKKPAEPAKEQPVTDANIPEPIDREGIAVDFHKPEESFPESSDWNETHDYNADQEVLRSDGEIKNLTIQFGNVPEKLHLTWFSKSSAKGAVTFQTEDGKKLVGSVVTQPSISVPGYHQNRAIISGLEPDTYYSYRVSNGNSSSPVYSYHTNDFLSNEFEFAIVSDQEIGIGDEEDNVLERHSNAWRLSLNRIKERLPKSSFILSLGDQVGISSEPMQYDALLDKSVLYSTPFLPVVGNHDVGTGSWGDHFFPPNSSPLGTAQGNDGDYWFIRGNVLFMIINTNTVQEKDIHETFVAETIAQHPDVKWRVVASHYSPASNVEKYQGTREDILPTFFYIAEHNNIDLFLGAHDHSYARSFFLDVDGDPIDAGEGVRGEFSSPGKPLFVVFSTATGCLYRDPADYPWIAASDQGYVPQVSHAQVTENSFTISTYHADSWIQLDSFTIHK